MQKARASLFGNGEKLNLKESILIPEVYKNGIIKCRIIYDQEIRQVEFNPYTVKPVNSLRLVRNDDIDYSFKYFDRKPLENLLNNKGSCDDVLIIRKGLITDTFYANVVFFDGFQYFTPAQPLLKGTKRQKLIDEGKIREDEIKVGDLVHFQEIHLINAMLDLNQSMINARMVCG
jgi:4-amino-4-deoxychorismate lyase